MGSVDERIVEFFDQYRPREYKKGQILLFADDKPEYVYHLESGKVKQYDVSEHGDEIIINVFKPPAFFPMNIVLNQTKNRYILEAETEIRIRQAPACEVISFLHENPEVTLDLLQRVYRGLDGILERMARLMKSSARERLVYEIIIDGKRFGQQRKDGTTVSKVREGDLAGRTGLTRETVSREIRKLVKDGLLSYKSGKLVILKPAELEAILAGQSQ